MNKTAKALVGLLSTVCVILAIAAISLSWQGARDHTAFRRANVALVQSAKNQAQTAVALRRATLALNQALANETRQSNEILHECVRLNIVRAEDNKSHFVDYKYMAQQVKFTAGSLKANYKALAHIGIPKSILKRALRQTEAALQTQRELVASKAWVPLTNCTAVALSSSGTYKPPVPTAFSRGLPPSTALSATNAAMPDPVGSVP